MPSPTIDPPEEAHPTTIALSPSEPKRRFIGASAPNTPPDDTPLTDADMIAITTGLTAMVNGDEKDGATVFAATQRRIEQRTTSA